MISRRKILQSATGALSVSLAACSTPFIPQLSESSGSDVVITDFELIPVRATARTLWIFVRIHTNHGVTGLSEASNAMSTDAAGVEALRVELNEFFSLIRNHSPMDVEYFRQQGRSRALQSLLAATAYSAIEQAMWDINGKIFNVPSYQLFGGKVRDDMPVYANINRAANPRTADGFAAIAASAYADGFRAMKAAPFDGYPVNGSAAEIAYHVDAGIDICYAIRDAVGEESALMIDCHSFFSISLAISVAERLQDANLTWYEEPVAPSMIEESLQIKQAIRQPMAGGELLFGLSGFRDIIQNRTFDVIMPDIKHCGGVTDFIQIAAMASDAGIKVSPHNPTGPVATAASIQVSAGLANLNYLEFQYGEVDWRRFVIAPVENFLAGKIRVSDLPGFGIILNETMLRENGLPV